jgi:hypothetical protein
VDDNKKKPASPAQARGPSFGGGFVEAWTPALAEDAIRPLYTV